MKKSERQLLIIIIMLGILDAVFITLSIVLNNPWDIIIASILTFMVWALAGIFIESGENE